ncbi:hypothetical protein QE152_g33777 [Popillia japonica]|uniref:Transposase n=1 Tax=Popillia japonica TaxID=7064 RepID=A0AAW1IVU0_POPJA
MIRKVKARLQRNPRRRGNQMAKELKISQRSIQRIFQNELKIKPYKFQKTHDLTPKQAVVDLEHSKKTDKARVNKEWLINHIPHFISSIQWLSNSPDANPMDYSIWAR